MATERTPVVTGAGGAGCGVSVVQDEESSGHDVVVVVEQYEGT